MQQRFPRIMGILNTTPDSFSDGGNLYRNGVLDLELAVKTASKMVDEGADILDIGGESSGPDSKNISLEEEIQRVVPVISMIRERFSKDRVLISVDTYKAEVARQAVLAGADLVNDVTALRGDPEMASVLVEADIPVVLMYSKDSAARTTREVREYPDVVATISAFFEERIAFAESRGILRRRIFLDPGLGFFVSGDPKYSFEIIDRLEEFQRFQLPIVLGPSRKSFLGGALGERLEKTIAACQKVASKGVSILRVHDVGAVRGALLKWL